MQYDAVTKSFSTTDYVDNFKSSLASTDEDSVLLDTMWGQLSASCWNISWGSWRNVDVETRSSRLALDHRPFLEMFTFDSLFLDRNAGEAVTTEPHGWKELYWRRGRSKIDIVLIISNDEATRRLNISHFVVSLVGCAVTVWAERKRCLDAAKIESLYLPAPVLAAQLHQRTLRRAMKRLRKWNPPQTLKTPVNFWMLQILVVIQE